MSWCRFKHGSVKEFLLSGDIGNNDSMNHHVCMACGFKVLDEPDLQFHLEGSRFCFEALSGKKQQVAPLVLSPRLHDHISTRMSGPLSATSGLCVSPERLFHYAHAVETDNESSSNKNTNLLGQCSF
jgi:hypothetical protein